MYRKLFVFRRAAWRVVRRFAEHAKRAFDGYFVGVASLTNYLSDQCRL